MSSKNLGSLERKRIMHLPLKVFLARLRHPTIVCGDETHVHLVAPDLDSALTLLEPEEKDRVEWVRLIVCKEQVRVFSIGKDCFVERAKNHD